ncbi:MAG: DUF4352 domain-containing protein, partial [Actinomycetota bacterium]|nr:DUF4352 domain-containing protein [Actinomycetota bacterium]
PRRHRRHRLRDALLLLAAVVVVAGGVWGMLAPRDSHHDRVGQGAVADVENGVMRVDGLADKTVGHAMAGMDMPDEVPAGMRRFAVNVSLAATGDDALTYSRRDFLVSGPGVKPVVPVRGDFEAGSVTAGSALSGTLTFDVPEEASVLRLSFQGGDPILLPALPEAGSTGHGPSAGTGHEHAHGDQTQGDQTQGDQTQGDQTQGDQTQDGHAHGDHAH